MKFNRHRYQNDAPGDTGTGPEPTPAPTPAPAPSPEPTAQAPDPKPAEPTPTEDKIGALLDTIGQEPKPAEPAAPDAKAPETDPPKPADPPKADAKPEPKADDLTPPEDISERSKGRWATLSERAKMVPELEKRATEAETALAGVRELVQQSGLQPEEFQGMLAMGRLYKSSDPAELKQALEQLDGLRADLATRLGVDAPGVDVLAAHPDLKSKVEGMTLSREDALEIVRLRNTAAQASQATAASRDMQQYQQTVQAAAKEMDATLAARAATPGHQAKVDHIRQYFADPARLQAFVTTYQPNQWKAAVLMMYDTYTPAPAMPTVPAAPQPLRPGHVASGVRVPNGKPVSREEAVTNAWDALGL